MGSAKLSCYLCIQALVLLCYLSKVSHAQLSPSESRILLQIQKHLEYPEALGEWNYWTNFCYLPPTSSMSVVCSGNHVTGLTIIGNKASAHSSRSSTNQAGGKFTISRNTLSKEFSIDSLFTALTKLTSLKNLSLISLGLWGPLPSKISRLSSLEALNMSSNFLYGKIPQSVSTLTSLKSFVLAGNLINGSLPDLSGLQSLQELDLGNNHIGPEFPSLSSNLIIIVLRNNSFRSRIPSQLRNFNKLQRLDVSSNHLVGPIPPFLFSLTALWYLNLTQNRLTGVIPKSTTCGDKLWLVDISSNLLTGTLPSCIGSKSSNKRVFDTWNCLSGIKYQHPTAVCQTQALAVMPSSKKHNKNENKEGKQEQSNSEIKLAVVIALVAGIVFFFGAITALLVWAICRRRRTSDVDRSKLIKRPASSWKSSDHASATPAIVASKYVPTTLRMPALGLPSYHAFTLKELEDATNNFDPENLMREEGSQGQLYKGFLQNGSPILIRSRKLGQKQSSKSLNNHIEVVSHLRNQNLVSVIGHCVVTYQDKSNQGSTIFVVFECVSNGSLRDHLTDWRRKDVLKWPQRMTISMGIARGIHYLHGGMAPGIFGNDLKIENVLLDETLTPKVSGYRIPLSSKDEAKGDLDAEKDDIYQFGAILLEILTGKHIASENQLEEHKQELEKSLTEPAAVMQQILDPVLRGTFAYQSVRTAAEIVINCLSTEPSRRPSMEDILWYLQYSIQVQQAWTTSGNLSLNSGNIGLHLQR